MALLASYELGMRLSHNIIATERQADSGASPTQSDCHARAAERVLSRIGEELDRLIVLLNAHQTSNAIDAVKVLSGLLDELERVASIQ